MRLRNALLAAALSAIALPAAAQPQVNVLCPMAAEWCNMAATEFEKATGIKVALTLKGSGESFATVPAEKANPKHDIWYGGTGDPDLQVAEQDLTIAYKSPLFGGVMEYTITAEIGELFVISMAVDRPLAAGAPTSRMLARHGVVPIAAV